MALKYFSNDGVVKIIITSFTRKRNDSLTMDLLEEQTVENSYTLL